MALVTLASRFNMGAYQYSDGVMSLPTATSFTYSTGMHTKVVYGSFTYDSGGNVSGTVTSLTYSINGELKYTMSALATPAAQMQAWCERWDGGATEMFAQVLAGDDTLIGSSEGDELRGGAGDDLMRGNAGNDTFFGGGGEDTMSGGRGKDTYYVDDLGDRVYEASNPGNDADQVLSWVDFRLPANVENLSLLGPAVNGRGNGLNNVLKGDDRANVLRGYGGNDTLYGGNGNDTLIGGSGNDTLESYGDATAFRFDTPLSARYNVDTIEDFNVFSFKNRFQLDDAVFRGIGEPGGRIAGGVFRVGTAALDANDRILYDNHTGRLYFDADGNGDGHAVLFAILTWSPKVAATDFYVI